MLRIFLFFVPLMKEVQNAVCDHACSFASNQAYDQVSDHASDHASNHASTCVDTCSSHREEDVKNAQHNSADSTLREKSQKIQNIHPSIVIESNVMSLVPCAFKTNEGVVSPDQSNFNIQKTSTGKDVKTSTKKQTFLQRQGDVQTHRMISDVQTHQHKPHFHNNQLPWVQSQ